ncbi:MAG: 4'-phosphopantetheinyl transferase superfamily protein [Prevotellaceae bacterium]|jgi:4'-phosphopantetheinyl transferase EntD|nr:4'-phosphopantetheinyl transferase superfamily protein [Prevotellaceae bacterium]
MLLFRQAHCDGSCIAVAEIPDSDSLLPDKFFSAQEAQEYRLLGSAKRMRERTAALQLLHHTLGVEDALHHYPNGKPYLAADSHRISISHTRRCVAVALHPCREVGVDVEEISRSFAKVAPRYLSAGELAHCRAPVQLCVAWCAKETVYKLAGEEGVDFAKHILLNLLNVDEEGSLAALFAGKGKSSCFTVHYKVIGDIAVAYAKK